MERPPRQGEERGGRRGSPQALTGGVSASRLLHAHALRGSGYARKIERTIHLLCAVQGDSSTGPPQSWWVSFDGCHGFAGPKAVGAERLESLARHGFGRRNERARPTGGLGGSAAVGRSVSCRWRGDLGPGAVAGVRRRPAGVRAPTAGDLGADEPGVRTGESGPGDLVAVDRPWPAGTVSRPAVASQDQGSGDPRPVGRLVQFGQFRGDRGGAVRAAGVAHTGRLVRNAVTAGRRVARSVLPVSVVSPRYARRCRQRYECVRSSDSLTFTQSASVTRRAPSSPVTTIRRTRIHSSGGCGLCPASHSLSANTLMVGEAAI
jgi:hypothetical protein